MNSDFARAYGLHLCAALVICGSAAAALFAVLDGLHRMAAGAFHAGLLEALASLAVATAVALAWHKTAHLIPDSDERGGADGST